MKGPFISSQISHLKTQRKAWKWTFGMLFIDSECMILYSVWVDFETFWFCKEIPMEKEGTPMVSGCLIDEKWWKFSAPKSEHLSILVLVICQGSGGGRVFFCWPKNQEAKTFSVELRPYHDPMLPKSRDDVDMRILYKGERVLLEWGWWNYMNNYCTQFDWEDYCI